MTSNVQLTTIGNPMADQTKLEMKRRRFPLWQWSVGIFATVALVASLAFAVCGWGLKIQDGGVKIYQAFVLGAWSLLPPIWFWFEYIFLFRNAFPEAEQSKLDRFKYQQDLSSKIWLAAVSVLLILYFWKDIGRP